MKKITLEEPDVLDKMLIEKATEYSNKVPFDYDEDLLHRTGTILSSEAVLIIRAYNKIYSPKISERVKCGSTIRGLQMKLRKYYE